MTSQTFFTGDKFNFVVEIRNATTSVLEDADVVTLSATLKGQDKLVGIVLDNDGTGLYSTNVELTLPGYWEFVITASSGNFVQNEADHIFVQQT